MNEEAKRRDNGQGTIMLRKDGRWQARLMLPDGTRKSYYGKTEVEVMMKLVEARKQFDQIKARRRARYTPVEALAKKEHIAVFLNQSQEQLREARALIQRIASGVTTDISQARNEARAFMTKHPSSAD